MGSNTYLSRSRDALELLLISSHYCGPIGRPFESGTMETRVINRITFRSWSTNAIAGAASYPVTGAVYIALYAGLDRLSLVHEFKGLGISL